MSPGGGSSSLGCLHKISKQGCLKMGQIPDIPAQMSEKFSKRSEMWYNPVIFSNCLFVLDVL